MLAWGYSTKWNIFCFLLGNRARSISPREVRLTQFHVPRSNWSEVEYVFPVQHANSSGGLATRDAQSALPASHPWLPGYISPLPASPAWWLLVLTHSQSHSPWHYWLKGFWHLVHLSGRHLSLTWVFPAAGTRHMVPVVPAQLLAPRRSLTPVAGGPLWREDPFQLLTLKLTHSCLSSHCHSGTQALQPTAWLKAVTESPIHPK